MGERRDELLAMRLHVGCEERAKPGIAGEEAVEDRGGEAFAVGRDGGEAVADELDVGWAHENPARAGQRC
ncbi:MAG TPA: hypothetical protein VKA80_04725 [Beijerinckiaceae bacterium]|nr:hypothetical protein [Beijerinckiaceae bacterium]